MSSHDLLSVDPEFDENQKSMLRLHSRFDQTVPQVLWHYTSISGLEGMLRTSELWLSNMLYLNDAMEHHLLRQRVASLADEVVKNVELRNDVKRAFSGDESPTFYVMCFSADGDLLSQWRAYADDGEGVAIGFNTSFLETYAVREARMYKVNYDNLYHDAAVTHSLSTLELGVARFPPAKPILEAVTYSHLWFEAGRCKSNGFASEQEYRLMTSASYSVPRMPCLTIKTNSPPQQLRFRVSQKKQLVPYVTLPIDPSDADNPPIVQIRLGPKNNSDSLRDAITWLLQTYDFDATKCEFSKSRLTYR
jgi:hypothetical protein